MSEGREIRSYDYINHPYEQVRDALSKGALTIFQSATKAADSRARSIASELRVQMGGIGVQADIIISIRKIDENASGATGGPITRLHLEWQAAKAPNLFPIMKAELALYPLTSTETQLDFLGFYKPPLGVAGKALNAIVGHRIAEVAVHRFLSEVAAFLRQSLA